MGGASVGHTCSGAMKLLSNYAYDWICKILKNYVLSNYTKSGVQFVKLKRNYVVNWHWMVDPGGSYGQEREASVSQKESKTKN